MGSHSTLETILYLSLKSVFLDCVQQVFVSCQIIQEVFLFSKKLLCMNSALHENDWQEWHLSVKECHFL